MLTAEVAWALDQRYLDWCRDFANRKDEDDVVVVVVVDDEPKVATDEGCEHDEFHMAIDRVTVAMGAMTSYVDDCYCVSIDDLKRSCC